MSIKLMLVFSTLLISACVVTTDKQTSALETTLPTPTTAKEPKSVATTPPSKPNEMSGCRPDRKGAAEVIPVRPRLHTVSGTLAGFDPCNKSVRFAVPDGTTRAPVMILMHGGGGASSNATIFAAFYQMGMAVLSFDAYEMNDLRQGELFWANQASYEARQRLFFKIAKQAYEWVLEQQNIDTSRIYFYGLSNGADVVLNIAGIVSSEHVKAVFAEGTAGAGLGLPDKLNVPVVMIFGKDDNYASMGNNNKRWLNQFPCRVNAPQGLYPERRDPTAEKVPEGNAKNCNWFVNRDELTQPTIVWIEEQKAEGADIKVWFYDSAAHGIFLDTPLAQRSFRSSMGAMGGNVGADSSAKSKLAEDIKAVIFPSGN